MPYTICGLIIPMAEEPVCVEHGWPFVSLSANLSIIPLKYDYILLLDGDETEPKADFEFIVPQWLLDLVTCFSMSAYVEAEFWAGEGMQASIVFEGHQLMQGPIISSAAINYALRQLGIGDERSYSFFGTLVSGGKDPFDVVGLGRHRSVDSWLGERTK